MLSTSAALAIACFALVALSAYVFSWFRRAKRSGELELFSSFGLSPDDYRLISSDLGGRTPKIFLKNRHIIGVSDAIFESRHDRSIAIGEAKSRRYRNMVRPRERFQVILYIGLARRYFRGRAVSGVIAYADRRVAVEYDEPTYRWLLGLVPEFRRKTRRFDSFSGPSGRSGSKRFLSSRSRL